MQGMAAKNITYNNITYDASFFAEYNYTSENLNASIKAMKRIEKVQNYSLFLNESKSEEDWIYRDYKRYG
jgi:hypothetical protein